MEALHHISSSPHVREKTTTRDIMRDVCIALAPATIFGIIHFGVGAAIAVIVTVATCVATEYLYERFMHKKITIGDFSAVVTGILLALNLPSTIPWWACILGGVFAILVVKMVFGGLGQNFMNPALGGRCFLLISFAGLMTDFRVDGVSSATPLAVIKNGGTESLLKMFLGTTGGTIGETSALLILVGAAYLFYKKVITWRIPVVYVGVFAVYTLLFGGHGFDFYYLACELCGGGLMLGAFFMANDYTTSPVTPLGQIIYAALCGILTGLFRYQGSAAEGVSYAIIFCNLLVPLIERFTIPLPFGTVRARKGGK